MSESTLLAFIHIEKTAGTALNHYLSRSLLGYHPCLSFEFSEAEELDQNFLDAKELRQIHRYYPLLRGIGGHSLRSNAGYDDGPYIVNYFTFLRDPVLRVLSQFHYHREVMKIDWTFDNFLASGNYNNLMCRRICGHASSEAAIHELQKRYYFVGLLEKFEESMRHFRILSKKKGYSFKNVEVGARNVRANRDDKRFIVSNEMTERVKAINTEDKKLYEFVQQSGPAVNGTVSWGDVPSVDGPVMQYQMKDHVTGILNRVLSVAYCRRVEYLVRDMSKR